MHKELLREDVLQPYTEGIEIKTDDQRLIEVGAKLKSRSCKFLLFQHITELTHRDARELHEKSLAMKATSFHCFWKNVPCEQRLHFRGMSWRVKSSSRCFIRFETDFAVDI